MTMTKFTFFFLSAFLFATFTAKSQSAKSSLEMGIFYEDKQEYEKAYDSYSSAYRKSNDHLAGRLFRGKKGDKAFEGSERVGKILIEKWYEPVKSDLTNNNVEKLIADFDFANNKMKKIDEQTLYPSIDVCNKALETIAAYSLKNLENNNTANIDDYTNFWKNTSSTIDAVKVLFMNKEEDGLDRKINISQGLSDKIAVAIKNKGCEQYTKMLKAAQKKYANAEWIPAYNEAQSSIDVAKTYNCNYEVAVNLMKSCVDKGGKKIFLPPLRGDNQNNFSPEFGKKITDKVNAKNNPFLHMMNQREFESALFKNDMTEESLEKLNPVDLGKKLNSILELNLNYVLICKVVKMKSLQPQLERHQATAYHVTYETEDVKNTFGDGYHSAKRYYTDGSRSYTKVKGTKKWEITLSVKLFDIVKKNVVFDELKDFSYESTISYNEGLDPKNYSSKSLAYKERSEILSGLLTAQDDWRKKFNREEFTPDDDVYKKAEKEYVTIISKLTFHKLLNETAD